MPGVSQTSRDEAFSRTDLENLLSSGTSSKAFICTAFKKTVDECASSQVGNTFAIMRRLQKLLLIDSHPQLGGIVGALIAQSSSPIAMATFVFDDCGVLESSGCLNTYLEVLSVEADVPPTPTSFQDWLLKIFPFGPQRPMLAIEDAPRRGQCWPLRIFRFRPQRPMLANVCHFPMPAIKDAPRGKTASPATSCEETMPALVPGENDRPMTSCKDFACAIAPGEVGFNRSFLREFHSARNFPGDFLECPLLPHQRLPSFALREGSRIQRLLVYQLPGMGKTRTMIAILHSHFSSLRPKLVLFPRRALCANFYQELLT